MIRGFQFTECVLKMNLLKVKPLESYWECDKGIFGNGFSILKLLFVNSDWIIVEKLMNLEKFGTALFSLK